jgi:FAD synthetase
VVIVARDSTVEKTKGRKPILSESERCAVVAALRVVDEAVVGYEGLDIGEVIEKIRPDVIALGYDQTEMENNVKAYVSAHELPIVIVRIGKFAENSLDSSTKIKQKILDKLSK